MARYILYKFGEIRFAECGRLVSRWKDKRVPRRGDFIFKPVDVGCRLYLFDGVGNARRVLDVRADRVLYYHRKAPVRYAAPYAEYYVLYGLSLKIARFLVLACYGRVRGMRILRQAEGKE